jgi:hypothetical protein
VRVGQPVVGEAAELTTSDTIWGMKKIVRKTTLPRHPAASRMASSSGRIVCSTVDTTVNTSVVCSDFQKIGSSPMLAKFISPTNLGTP